MIKKLIYIIIILLISVAPTLAETENAYVQYSGYDYAFQPGDELKFEANANKNMNLYDKSRDNTKKMFYLKEALRYYFLLSKIQPNSVEAHVGLGRIYDELQLDRYSKEHFFLAYNLDNQNAKMNFYFGNFYYKRSDFITALEYYKPAYKNGYSNSYFLNNRLGNLYEKLADIETAKFYYKKALKINSHDSNLKDKIHSLDDLNYTQSQYYLFKK